jgi:hypothetical protein
MRPTANAEQLSVRSLKPMPQDKTKPQPKMIGFENLLNMTDKDRAQAVWDKAMTPEAKEHIEKYMAFKAGHAPDPGKYTGPIVDFDKAIKELEEEYPETHDE